MTCSTVATIRPKPSFGGSSRNFMKPDNQTYTKFLGIQIEQNLRRGVTILTQSEYIDELKERFSLEDAHVTDTPIDFTPLTKAMYPTSDDDKDDMASVPYRELIGHLLYIARCTPPEISYSVNVLSKYNSNPGRAHWTAAKRVLRYLEGVKHMGIVNGRGGNELLKAYADTDWAGNRDDRRSATGFVIYLADGPISYNSVSQKSVALSSYEWETMSGSTCASEAIYANRLRLEMEANKAF